MAFDSKQFDELRFHAVVLQPGAIGLEVLGEGLCRTAVVYNALSLVLSELSEHVVDHDVGVEGFVLNLPVPDGPVTQRYLDWCEKAREKVLLLSMMAANWMKSRAANAAQGDSRHG